jgi:hypothetical protein
MLDPLNETVVCLLSQHGPDINEINDLRMIRQNPMLRCSMVGEQNSRARFWG